MILQKNDTDLWLDFKQGDACALEKLYQRHFVALCTYGCRINPDSTLVEDAIQDVFVDLWRRKEHLSKIENVKFYLLRAMRNQLIRNNRHDIFDGSEDINDFLDHLATISTEQNTISLETQQARSQIIKKALDHLSNRQREAIHLRFYQGMSLDESAELMGISKQVIKNLLSKAYALLRITLKTAISVFVMAILG